MKRKVAIALVAFTLGMMTRGYGVMNGAATSGVLIDYWFSNDVKCYDIGFEIIGNPGPYMNEC